MKDIINKLSSHNTLSKNEAKKVLLNISKGKYNNSQISSFLTIFMMRNITLEELQGFKEALLELCIKIDLSDYNAIVKASDDNMFAKMMISFSQTIAQHFAIQPEQAYWAILNQTAVQLSKNIA